MSSLFELLSNGAISMDQLVSGKVRVRYIGYFWETDDDDFPKNNDIGVIKQYVKGENRCLVHFPKRSGKYNGNFNVLLKKLVLAPRKNNF